MLITPEILQYAQLYSSSQPQYLSDLERETALKTTQPIMLSGALQGRFLSFISKLIKPTCILEIGTFTGFSALCLAEGLAQDGVLHTIEINNELQYLIDKYVAIAEMQEKIKVHFGDATKIIAQLNIEPDLVFIDADKTNYKNYYEQVLPMLAPNGIILLDNMLFHGQVLEDKKSKNAEAIAQLNEFLSKDERVEVMLLPLRDGITMVRKLR
jgi:caffeoyl-CoA O-methyltransferase